MVGEMKKLMIGTALLLLSAVVHAEWVFVAGDNFGSNFYADPTTKRRSGDVIKMWVLFDKAQADASGQSIKVLEEYHCRHERSRVIAAIPFSGKMGSGNSRGGGDVPNAEWTSFPPDAVTQKLFNYACK